MSKLYINDSLYKTYRFNDKNPFYLTIPNEPFDEYELYLSFPDENPNPAKIKQLNDIIIRTNPQAIHLICNIKRSNIDEFGEYNDNRVALYKQLQRRLFGILASTYEYLKKKNKAIKIPIQAIKQNDADTKLINWLEIERPSLIKGIDYSKIKKAYNANIFSGTMAIPFITKKDSAPKVRRRLWQREKGYTKFHLVLTLVGSLIFGITIAKLLIK